jgi:hypothetical protein
MGFLFFCNVMANKNNILFIKLLELKNRLTASKRYCPEYLAFFVEL